MLSGGSQTAGFWLVVEFQWGSPMYSTYRARARPRAKHFDYTLSREIIEVKQCVAVLLLWWLIARFWWSCLSLVKGVTSGGVQLGSNIMTGPPVSIYNTIQMFEPFWDQNQYFFGIISVSWFFMQEFWKQIGSVVLRPNHSGFFKSQNLNFCGSCFLWPL